MPKEQLSPEILKFKDEIANQLIKKIQLVRSRGMLQVEIAEYLGISQPRLSNLINYHSAGNRDKLSVEWMLNILMKLSPKCFSYSFDSRFTVALDIQEKFRIKES